VPVLAVAGIGPDWIGIIASSRSVGAYAAAATAAAIIGRIAAEVRTLTARSRAFQCRVRAICHATIRGVSPEALVAEDIIADHVLMRESLYRGMPAMIEDHCCPVNFCMNYITCRFN